MPFQPAFLSSLAAHDTYPTNLAQSSVRQQLSKTTRRRIERRTHLFTDSSRCNGVHLLEAVQSRSPEIHKKQTLEELQVHVETSLALQQRDPWFRSVHIGAPSSRDPLDISEDMFTWLLTYHEVMPKFFDFISPFGLQYDGRRDPHAGGFYSDSDLAGNKPEPVLGRLGRSESQLRYCYTLQAPEPAVGKKYRWSIRQASIWHNLDLLSERQVWIVVQANPALLEQFQQRVYSRLDAHKCKCGLCRNLGIALTNHLDICDWAANNWQEYITFLEDTAREALRPATQGQISRAATAQTFQSSQTEEKMRSGLRGALSPNKLAAKLSAVKAGSFKEKVPDVEKGVVKTVLDNSQRPPEFTFDHLQDVQEKEDIANTAKTILVSNAVVIQQLRHEYSSLQTLPAESLDPSARVLLDAFDHKLAALGSTFVFLQARVDAYAKVLQDRRRLLETALQYQSASRMEEMTKYMHIETVRMRVITVVTVLFLPATFASSFLNTTVLTFPDGSEGQWDESLLNTILGKGALEWFVLISVPAMLFMCILWFVMRHRAANV